jgi:hypothetical protein
MFGFFASDAFLRQNPFSWPPTGGPTGDERIEKIGEQVGQYAEEEHRCDERRENSELDPVRIAKLSRGCAGTRTMENVLPEREEEKCSREQTNAGDGRSPRRDGENAAEDQELTNETVEAGKPNG